MFLHYAMRAYAYQKGVMFFGYAGKGLLKYEVGTNRQSKYCKGSVQKKVKTIILAIVALAVFISIVHPYLSLLGTQKSQSMEPVKRTNLTYNVTDLPELFPVHQFSFFEKEELHDQMACSLKQDAAECWNINERRCISKGITTKEYHKCIIKMLKKDGQNSTQFCYDHFDEMQLWTGEKSPETLLYYQLKYDCLKSSGKKHGKQYCRDINKFTPGTTTQDLFSCYMKHKVDYGVEFCEYNFPNDELKLVKCFAQKGVPIGPRACEILYREDIPALIACYDGIPLVNTRVCDLKYDQNKWDNATIQECYKNGSYTLDQQFCEDNYKTMDEKYDCFERIGLNMKKDRVFCERKFVDDTDGKYDCLESLGRPKLGEFCYQKFYQDSQFEERYACLAQEGVPKTAAYCQRKFQPIKDEAKKEGLEYDMTDELDCIFGLGIPKFATTCPKPSDPEIDREEMKQLTQDYKEAKVIALTNDFLGGFPDYFKNLAINEVVDQKFLDINYALYVDQNPSDYFYEASSFISKRGQVVGETHKFDTSKRRAIGKIQFEQTFPYNGYEITLHEQAKEGKYTKDFPFPGFSQGQLSAIKGQGNEIKGTWEFASASDVLTLTLSDGKTFSLQYASSRGENGSLHHKWQTSPVKDNWDVNFVQSYPFRSVEQILKCDVSPSYNDFSGLEELNYVAQPVKDPITINSVSLFAPNNDMSSFTVFIGSTSDDEQFDYCNMIPADYEAGTRITITCEAPVLGNKVIFVRNKSVFTISGLAQNRITLCSLQINGLPDDRNVGEVLLKNEKVTYDFKLGGEKALLGSVVAEKDLGGEWTFSDEAALLAISGKAFKNDKVGGLIVGSPLQVSATYQSLYGAKGEAPTDPIQYNLQTEFSQEFKAINVLTDIIFENEFSLGDMISGLDVTNLNATFVDQLKGITYTGKQIYENDTLLDDHEAAHDLHQSVKAGFSFSGCFLAEIAAFQTTCKTKYANQPENRQGCLYQLEKEGDGFASTISSEYCMNRQESTSELFYYKLTNKYECLKDDTINPIPIKIDREVIDCFLRLTDQYLLEQCLKNYESLGKLGFKEADPEEEEEQEEDEEDEDNDDDLEEDSPALYYGLSRVVEEEKKEEIISTEKDLENEEKQSAESSQNLGTSSVPTIKLSPKGRGVIIPTEYFVDKRFDGGTYDFTAQYQDFVCGNTNMSFYQNPQALNPNSSSFATYDTRIYLECSTFEQGDQIVAHYYMPALSSDDKWSGRKLFVNRTEFSVAQFTTTYTKNLEFITIQKAFMHTGSNMKDGVIALKDYQEFLQDAKTTKLYEARPQIITEEFIDPIKLKAFSKTSIRIGQVPILSILGYALVFEDNNGTEIAINPMENKPAPYRVPTENATVNTVLLDFSFTEEIWIYKYYQFIDIVEALGGIGNAIGVFMAELTMLFIWLFFLDMIRIIYGRYKHDWTIVRNSQLKENVASYKRVILCLQKNETTQGNEGGYLEGGLTKRGTDVDLDDEYRKKVEMDQKVYNISQDQLKQDLEDLQKINELEKIDQNEVLEAINQRYGMHDVEVGKIVKKKIKKEVFSDTFDDKTTQLELTRKRMGFSLHKVATMIKRRISFYSLYENSDELELLKIQHELLKTQLKNNLVKIVDRQRAIEDKLFSDGVPSEENSLKALNQNDDLTSFISQTEVKPIKLVDEDLNSHEQNSQQYQHQKVE